MGDFKINTLVWTVRCHCRYFWWCKVYFLLFTQCRRVVHDWTNFSQSHTLLPMYLKLYHITNSCTYIYTWDYCFEHTILLCTCIKEVSHWSLFSKQNNLNLSMVCLIKSISRFLSVRFRYSQYHLRLVDGHLLKRILLINTLCRLQWFQVALHVKCVLHLVQEVLLSKFLITYLCHESINSSLTQLQSTRKKRKNAMKNFEIDTALLVFSEDVCVV